MANSVLARAESGNLERTKRRYSLTAAECSLEEIAEAWGVSRERVRVIEANALRKLRKAFLDDPALRLEAESMGLIGEDEPTPQVEEQLTFGDSFFRQIHEPGGEVPQVDDSHTSSTAEPSSEESCQLLTVNSSPPPTNDRWRPVPGVYVLSKRRIATRPLSVRVAELFPDEAKGGAQ